MCDWLSCPQAVPGLEEEELYSSLSVAGQREGKKRSHQNSYESADEDHSFCLSTQKAHCSRGVKSQFLHL